jgi:hypothetical protein
VLRHVAVRCVRQVVAHWVPSQPEHTIVSKVTTLYV